MAWYDIIGLILLSVVLSSVVVLCVLPVVFAFFVLLYGILLECYMRYNVMMMMTPNDNPREKKKKKKTTNEDSPIIHASRHEE